MKITSGYFLGLLTLFCAVLGCAQESTSSGGCKNRLRALLDVGSQTTKLNLSEIGICNGGQAHLVRVIDDKTSVELPLEAGKDSNGALLAPTQDLLVKTLTELRDKALNLAHERASNYSSVEFAAVGTQTIRTVTNLNEFSGKLKAIGIPIVVLSQKKEGEAGFASAHEKGIPQSCLNKDLVVWDVRGGSQEFTSADRQGKPEVQGISFSSENFKVRLISHLPMQKRKSSCTFTDSTPNPIGWKNSSVATMLAESQAETNLSKNFQIRPLNQCVVGIGDVHNHSIAQQVAKFWPQISSCACEAQSKCLYRANSYSKKQLQCLALWLSEKSDCDAEVKGPYSTTAVSNLFLVLGFMEKLKITDVETLDVNMADNLILNTDDLAWSPVQIRP